MRRHREPWQSQIFHPWRVFVAVIVRRVLQDSLLHWSLNWRNNRLVRDLFFNMNRLVVATKLIRMLTMVARLQCFSTWREGGQAKCRNGGLATLGPSYQGGT